MKVENGGSGVSQHGGSWKWGMEELAEVLTEMNVHVNAIWMPTIFLPKEKKINYKG